MTSHNRRDALQRTAALGAAAMLTGLAQEAAAATPAGAPLFDVAAVTLPIHDSARTFPVRRIYCIGRNYAAHALERGSDPEREPPFFFQKPTDAIQLARPGETLQHRYPPLTKNYHHELELVALLHKGGRDIRPEDALACVYGYAVGLDMTRRDLQNEMAAQKKPWEIGKSFDHSAVIGPVHPASATGPFTRGAIELSVNGKVRQSSDLSKMIWSVAEQISRLSQSSELFPGDIIYSGTPENVGPVVPGDTMTARIEGLYQFDVKVV